MDYRLQVALLGCDEGEALVQIETHLMTENAFGARSCPIRLVDALLKDPAQ
jgi:hypothetical protein